MLTKILSLFCKNRTQSNVSGFYRFTLKNNGRCGTITCAKEDLELKIDWEMSGTPDADILLAPMNLSQWASGIEIPRAEQLEILNHLRAWFDARRINADIARPTAQINSSSRCERSGCRDHAMAGSAYCPFHYDETLLK